MALVEYEFLEPVFERLLHMMLTAAPIPFGTLDALPEGQLITQIEWRGGTLRLGVLPDGHTSRLHTLPARVEVRIHHVSVEELEADPDAAGSVTAATVWLRVSLAPFSPADAIRIDTYRVDIAGAAPQHFVPGLRVRSFGMGEVAGDGGGLPEGLVLRAGAVLRADGCVTLRMSTGGDDLALPAANRLIERGDGDWLLRLSGELIEEILVQRIAAGLEQAREQHPDLRVEEAPRATWAEWPVWAFGGSSPPTGEGSPLRWGAVLNCKVRMKDACPGVFGSDITVKIQGGLAFEPPLPAPGNEHVGFDLYLSADTSTWDVFRCWLGTGGVGSLLGFNAVPTGTGYRQLLGKIVLLGSLVAVEVLRRLVNREIPASLPDPRLELVGSSERGSLYRGHLPMPYFAPPTAYDVGRDGLVAVGNFAVLPAHHRPAFDPSPYALTGEWRDGEYNCDTRRWEHRYVFDHIRISNAAFILERHLTDVPVTIFSRTTTAIPAEDWTLTWFSAESNPYVEGDQPRTPLVALSSRGPGRPDATGRAYLHTSAGLARYDLGPLPAAPQPGGEQDLRAKIDCLIRDVERHRVEGNLGPLAGTLAALARHLWQVPPRRDEALAAATEAVDVYRQLAISDAENYRPLLAMQLATLAGYQGTLENHDHAVASAHQAVDLYRQLTATAPDHTDHWYRLVWAIQILARQLNTAGRRDDTAGLGSEALTAAHHIADADATTRANTALQLAMMAGHLVTDEAAAPAQHAVQLYRQLTATTPDHTDHWYRLAWSLHILAAQLWNSEARRQEALPAIDESVDLYRRLAADDPDRFGQQLATAEQHQRTWSGQLGMGRPD
jgi:tetratricopeptide (TPR) repeat protein